MVVLLLCGNLVVALSAP
ncbi:hypothetical protein B6N23_04820 [Halomonas alkalicola]|uniref:Uncharacterized protein n=1 Tax=Halomonas alkalicola TaxID=1930622 RepID=A0ABY9H8U2_9GAMM|nr:hypothetical protein B6N23_04820 [Halomonas alkalicola]